jgi:hypothetical protein
LNGIDLEGQRRRRRGTDSVSYFGGIDHATIGIDPPVPVEIHMVS